MFTIAALWGAVIHAADAAAADTDPAPMFSLHGFGTLGETHADARDADFIGNPVQANGAGFAQAWSSGVDSKLGLQMDARLSGKLTAVLQVVSQHGYDNSWTPNIEWANLKYQITPDLSIRAGRTVADFFMLSDSRLVGYTYPWIRPPVELYGEAPITNLDGIGVSYRCRLGEMTNSLTVTYAKSKFNFPGGVRAKSVGNFFVTADTLETGPITIRVGYESFVIELDSSALNSLFDGFTQFGDAAVGFGLPVAGAQAFALRDMYEPHRSRYSVATIGVTYDRGDWLLMAEWVKVTASAAISNSTAWYVTAGHRFGNFMPYATSSRLTPDTKRERGISTAELPPPLAAGASSLNAGLTATLNALAPSQISTSIGMRWDFMKNTDLKIQYDHETLGADSSGRLGDVQPGFQPGGTVNVFSVAVDFVF